VTSPEVVAEGYSVRVRLHPSPVLSRVVTEGRVLRGDPLPWLRREVAVAQYLHDRGGRVAPPWISPGPFLVDGLEVSLWTWLDPAPGSCDQATFATMLFELHELLAPCPLDLPLLIGPLTDIAGGMRASEDTVLHRAAARLMPEAASWPRRPLHGDAHLANILSTTNGFVWIDFEDACVGPLEWDFASRTVSDEAVDAYPGTVDRALLERCRQLRRLQVLAAVLTDDVQPEGLYDELVEALAPEM
jgi:hypothetical protein